MELGPFIIALAGIVAVFGIPIVAIVTEHRRKMIELQIRLKNEGSSAVAAQMDALREEVRSLRDTTMQYDMSFDTALQRMEQRMGHLERRVGQVEGTNPNEISIGR